MKGSLHHLKLNVSISVLLEKRILLTCSYCDPGTIIKENSKSVSKHERENCSRRLLLDSTSAVSESVLAI